MTWFDEVLNSLGNIGVYWHNIRIENYLEILLIAMMIYYILRWVKNTRAWALLKGLVLIVVFLFIANMLHMSTIIWISQNIIGVAITAVVVILQPELRKALEQLGNKNVLTRWVPIFDRKNMDDTAERTITEIARACVEMGKVRTGALIVMERKESLSDYEKTGIAVDAIVSSSLLINIFEHNTPLHDGAVIVKGNRVASATCYLPLSDNLRLSKELGTRHRAGVGISEATDSVTIIVSEETGKISVAFDGNLTRNMNEDSLIECLSGYLIEKEEENRNKFKFKGRSKADNEAGAKLVKRQSNH